MPTDKEIILERIGQIAKCADDLEILKTNNSENEEVIERAFEKKTAKKVSLKEQIQILAGVKKL
jgi:predicted phage-related endonuclease